jgi:hypothetical protein
MAGIAGFVAGLVRLGIEVKGVLRNASN